MGASGATADETIAEVVGSGDVSALYAELPPQAKAATVTDVEH
jgi:hypothetical protein